MLKSSSLKSKPLAPRRCAWSLLITGLLIFTGVLSACAPAQVKPPELTLETYPKVDGSTVTIPLSEALAAKLTGASPEDVRMQIKHNRTHGAYVNLIHGDADLIFVTAPSEGELALAEEKGVELEVIPIVSEAFVFLVNANNPVKGVTHAQLQDIYTGDIDNWKAVGGEDLAIIPYQRPVNSGSQTGFLELVMQDKVPMAAPMAQVPAEMGMLIDVVAAYDNGPAGIGYSYYYFVTDMWQNADVKLLEVDGVYPDPEHIASGAYPFKTAYYAVMRKDLPEDAPERRVVDWILSEDGQQLMEDSGYVKIGKL